MNNPHHFIIVRLAQNSGLSHNIKKIGFDSNQSFFKKRIDIYDNITRASLVNQTNQNFTLISLVQESASLNSQDLGSKLPNEHILYNNGNKNLSINLFLKEKYKDIEYAIFTRLDSDDALPINFVEEVQNHYKKDIEGYLDTYVDVDDMFVYSNIDKKIKKINLCYCSQFISILEKTKNTGFFDISVYAHSHAKIGYIKKGERIKYLSAFRFVGDHNVTSDSQFKLESKFNATKRSKPFSIFTFFNLGLGETFGIKKDFLEGYLKNDL
jgi:hypothetical protein